MLGFQKGWDSVKKHIEAIRSPCFFYHRCEYTPLCAGCTPWVVTSSVKGFDVFQTK